MQTSHVARDKIVDLFTGHHWHSPFYYRVAQNWLPIAICDVKSLNFRRSSRTARAACSFNPGFDFKYGQLIDFKIYSLVTSL